VVGSQTANLTPGPSFAHNLGDRCPNAQCEGIFDIYASRPFQWHQEHPNARCFGPCCRALNIRESRRTPNPQLFQVLGFTPTLGQVRVATSGMLNGERGSMNVNRWTWLNLFWNILLTSKKYGKNIPWHMVNNISWHGGIFYHVYMDET
jgi:hypothetical protein